MIRVHFQEHPFKSDLTIRDVELQSLRGIFESFAPSLGIEHAVFIVNDTVVTDLDLIPSEDDIVYVKFVPESEAYTKGSAILGGILIALGGLITVATGGASLPFTGKMIFLGFGLLMSAGVSALIVANRKFDDQEAANSLRGSANLNQAYSPVPVIYGTHYLAPDLIAPDYTRMVETAKTKADDIYLRQLYVLGQTPVVIDNLAFGDTNAVVRSGKDYSATLTKNSSTRITVTTTESLDGVLGSAVNGYNYVLLEGFKHPSNNREFKIASRPSSTSVVLEADDWCLNETASPVRISTLMNTDVYKDSDIDARIISDGVFTGTPYPQVVQESYIGTEIKKGMSNPPVFTTPTGTKRVTIKVTLPGGLYNQTDSGKKSTRSLSLTAQYKLSTDPPGSWTTVGSVGGLEDFNTAETIYGQIDITFPTNTYDVTNKYMVRVIKNSDDSSTDKNDYGTNVVQLYSVISYKYDEDGKPVEPASDKAKELYTFLALEVKAGEQFSGQLNNVSCVVRQGCRVLDTEISDEGGTKPWKQWVPGYSSNPAAIFLNVLTNENLNRYPIGTDGWDTPEALPLDWRGIKEWYQFCETNGYACDGVVSNPSTVQEEISKICLTGRATATVKDGLYTVVIDQKKTAVQMFTPRNSWGFSASRTFTRDLDGVKVKYTNSDIGYQNDMLQVDRTGSQYRTYEEFTIDYVTGTANAKKYAAFMYNVLQLRQEVYTFNVDFEHLVCTAGDRIKLQHDVPLIGQASGRVADRIIANGQLTGVRLDESVTFDDGLTYGVLIRRPKGGAFELVQLPVHADETQRIEGDAFIVSNLIMFNSPQNVTDVSVDDLIAFGLHNQVTEDLLIMAINAGEDLTAELVCTLYDEAVYDLGSMYVRTPMISEPASTGRKASIPSTTDRWLAELQAQVTGAIGNRLFYETQPAPPYSVGDQWKRGINTYVAKVSRTADQQFHATDWELLTTETFQAVSSETFGEPHPEDRWYIAGTKEGVRGQDIRLLWFHPFTVNNGADTKDKILDYTGDDDDYWASDNGKLLVPSPMDGFIRPSSINAIVGLGQDITLWGRYGESAWVGESYDNLYPSPVKPSSTALMLNGEYVLQCYTGEVACAYGVAKPNEPLRFTADGSVPLTVTGATYVSLTHTKFSPPFVDGAHTANNWSIDTTQMDVSGSFSTRERTDTYRVLFDWYKDTGNHMTFGILGDVYRVEYTSGGDMSTFDIPMPDTGLTTTSFHVWQDDNLNVSLGDELYVYVPAGQAGLYGTENGDYKLYGTETATYNIYGKVLREDFDLISGITKIYVGAMYDDTLYFNDQVFDIQT